jgi:hypothetical protein
MTTLDSKSQHSIVLSIGRRQHSTCLFLSLGRWRRTTKLGFGASPCLNPISGRTFSILRSFPEIQAPRSTFKDGDARFSRCSSALQWIECKCGVPRPGSIVEWFEEPRRQSRSSYPCSLCPEHANGWLVPLQVSKLHWRSSHFPFDCISPLAVPFEIEPLHCIARRIFFFYYTSSWRVFDCSLQDGVPNESL